MLASVRLAVGWVRVYPVLLLLAHLSSSGVSDFLLISCLISVGIQHARGL